MSAFAPITDVKDGWKKLIRQQLQCFSDNCNTTTTDSSKRLMDIVDDAWTIFECLDLITTSIDDDDDDDSNNNICWSGDQGSRPTLQDQTEYMLQQLYIACRSTRLPARDRRKAFQLFQHIILTVQQLQQKQQSDNNSIPAAAVVECNASKAVENTETVPPMLTDDDDFGVVPQQILPGHSTTAPVDILNNSNQDRTRTVSDQAILDRNGTSAISVWNAHSPPASSMTTVNHHPSSPAENATTSNVDVDRTIQRCPTSDELLKAIFTQGSFEQLANDDHDPAIPLLPNIQRLVLPPPPHTVMAVPLNDTVNVHQEATTVAAESIVNDVIVSQTQYFTHSQATTSISAADAAAVSTGSYVDSIKDATISIVPILTMNSIKVGQSQTPILRPIPTSNNNIVTLPGSHKSDGGNDDQLQASEPSQSNDNGNTNIQLFQGRERENDGEDEEYVSSIDKDGVSGDISRNNYVESFQGNSEQTAGDTGVEVLSPSYNNELQEKSVESLLWSNIDNRDQRSMHSKYNHTGINPMHIDWSRGSDVYPCLSVHIAKAWGVFTSREYLEPFSRKISKKNKTPVRHIRCHACFDTIDFNMKILQQHCDAQSHRRNMKNNKNLTALLESSMKRSRLDDDTVPIPPSKRPTLPNGNLYTPLKRSGEDYHESRVHNVALPLPEATGIMAVSLNEVNHATGGTFEIKNNIAANVNDDSMSISESSNDIDRVEVLPLTCNEGNTSTKAISQKVGDTIDEYSINWTGDTTILPCLSYELAKRWGPLVWSSRLYLKPCIAFKGSQKLIRCELCSETFGFKMQHVTRHCDRIGHQIKLKSKLYSAPRNDVEFHPRQVPPPPPPLQQHIANRPDFLWNSNQFESQSQWESHPEPPPPPPRSQLDAITHSDQTLYSNQLKLNPRWITPPMEQTSSQQGNDNGANVNQSENMKCHELDKSENMNRNNLEKYTSNSNQNVVEQQSRAALLRASSGSIVQPQQQQRGYFIENQLERPESIAHSQSISKLDDETVDSSSTGIDATNTMETTVTSQNDAVVPHVSAPDVSKYSSDMSNPVQTVSVVAVADKAPTKACTVHGRDATFVTFNEFTSNINILSVQKRLATWDPFLCNDVVTYVRTTSPVVSTTPSTDLIKTAASFTLKTDTFCSSIHSWGKKSPEQLKYSLLLRMLPIEYGVDAKTRADIHQWPKGTIVQFYNNHPIPIEQRKQLKHNLEKWSYMSRELSLEPLIADPKIPTQVHIFCYDDERYILCVSLSRYRSLDEVYGSLFERDSPQKINVISFEDGLQRAVSYAASLVSIDIDGDEEGEMNTLGGYFIVSLNCPISRTLMEIPVRGKNCTHHQCFDLRNYLSINTYASGNRWRCAVCESFVSVPSLQICNLTKQLINEFRSKITWNRDRVQFSSDGSYELLEPRKNRRQKVPVASWVAIKLENAESGVAKGCEDIVINIE